MQYELINLRKEKNKTALEIMLKRIEWNENLKRDMEWKSREGHRMKMKERKKDLRKNDWKESWQRVSNVTGVSDKNTTVGQKLETISQENFLGIREIKVYLLKDLPRTWENRPGIISSDHILVNC